MPNKETRSKVLDFIKGSTILIISNVFLKAINFFLLPLYTKNLTPSMMGISDSITTMMGILFPFLTMGLDSAYSAFYFEKKDEQRAEKVFSTLAVSFFMLGLFTFILMMFSRQISLMLFRTTNYSYMVNFALISVSFNLWFLPYSLELRIENKMFLFGLVNIISSLSMIFLNILFISILHMRESSLVISVMLVHGEQFLILLLMVRKRPSKKFFDKDLLKQMLHFSIPLMPMTVMMWILTLSDRYVLLYFHGVNAVGLYGIGLRFTNLLNVVISAVSMAYTTFAFSSKEDDNVKKVYYYIFNIEAFFLLGISFSLGVFGREVVHLMSDTAYASAYKSLRDLMFAQSIYAMSTIVGYGIYFEKKSIYSFFAVTCGAVVNLILNIILIPTYGIDAAALTTLVGYLINYLITLCLSKKVYPCNYGERKVGITMVILYVIAYVAEEVVLVKKFFIWVVVVICFGYAYRMIVKDTFQYLAKTWKYNNMGGEK